MRISKNRTCLSKLRENATRTTGNLAPISRFLLLLLQEASNVWCEDSNIPPLLFIGSMTALNIKGTRGQNTKAINPKSINAKHPLANINATHTLSCAKSEMYQYHGSPMVNKSVHQ